MTQPSRSRNADDEYLPEAPDSHESHVDKPEMPGITPQQPETMPRGEDDEETKRRSPEFHDLPDAPWQPKK